ncbi:hypothetical protein BUALT_Bualt12G0059600 [Buddleja alternifolia]|uniref:Uncharacterized protein n=1 Tax=Buddleja alternifolia TaxID=168488 RepID=A0AAV6WNS3_9LAMI|nr:hypothetical protein BUALT_Bualt12G0059600 [Buddleja alternifolia]
MELKNNQEEQNLVGFCSISRVLAREASLGQSSRIFYRASEGVPFRWEMQPGTPKHPQQEDVIPPLSPPPLMQSLGLPLPNMDDHDEIYKGSSLKMSKIWSFKKMVKDRMNLDHISKKVEVLVKRRSNKEEEGSRFGDSNGELVASLKGSSFSSSSLSSTLSFSSEGRVVDSSRLPRVSIDGPFCCSSWNIQAILDEGNTKLYYCKHHKTAFAVEEDDSFLSRILSRVSTADQFSGPLNNDITPTGTPFRWEMQPGTAKTPPENELIPPPSPPPALQSRALPLPRLHDGGEKTEDSKWTRVWSKVKNGCYKRKKESVKKMNKEISFRYRDDEGYNNATAKESVSVSPLSKGGWRVSKIKRGLKGGYFSCGPWSRRDVLVLARTKLKSFKS